jgi:hypothetical protein
MDRKRFLGTMPVTVHQVIEGRARKVEGTGQPQQLLRPELTRIKAWVSTKEVREMT